jgi:hypothetical protein
MNRSRFLPPLPGPISRVSSGRPPGTPPYGPAPRLPTVPIVPYEPPLAPAPPPLEEAVLGVAGSIESQTVDFEYGGATGVETSLYVTKRRWRACDVFVDVPPNQMPASGCLTILVYAIWQGSRTLVASGRYGDFDVSGILKVTAPRWVVAARASAERFEIAAFFSTSVAATDGVVAKITVVATDEAVEPPSLLGLWPLGQGNNTSLGALVPDVQIVGYTATINVAGARWLHLRWADSNGAMPAGPSWCIPIGAVAGDGIEGVFPTPFRIPRKFIAVDISSTISPTTAANADGQVRVWVR